MKRPPNLRKLVLFLLLGAIVNVAVAWASTWVPLSNPPRREIKIGFSHETEPRWFIFIVCEDEYGLPLRCLRYRAFAHRDYRAGKPYVLDSTEFGIHIPKVNPTGDAWRDIHELPWLPIWPGFAINTFFYAAILWVLFAAPGRVRRWRRSKRGLCPACAYPVGQSPICTECGAAVTPKAMVT